LSISRRLKSLGVRIAMDDFGAGYSSLSYLRSFPFDKIKIDKSFISGVRENPQSSAIVRAVINLGRGLQLPVVAEGVETKENSSSCRPKRATRFKVTSLGAPSQSTSTPKWSEDRAWRCVEPTRRRSDLSL
jgi:EAL domain-containing protein (putative c-di-GMP-specific phosphodiesterase class I)